MIKQPRKAYAPAELERQTQEFWRRTKAYEKTRKFRSNGKDYYFGDGPPFTTGSIHLGQALNKTIKDAVVRWRRMQGHNVRDQPGYDMHGLPIEVQVEKSLGITNKREIEDLGIERFVTTCRQYALELLAKMTEQFQQLGVWLDWENPYMTIRSPFIEAVWWTMKRAHEKGLLTKSIRSLPWCTRCETALADAEVEYAEETDPSVYVMFKLKDHPNESLLIWTTTPWTLPANMAVAVHPGFTYAKVELSSGEFIWVLEETAPRILEEVGVEGKVVELMAGADMVGWAYEHPLAVVVPFHMSVYAPKAHTVIRSAGVTNEFTGLVHIAPGHGPEDFELGQVNALPAFSPVDERGFYTAEGGAYAGRSVRESNEKIIEDLKALGVLFHREELVHRYGHCWRCRTPIIYRVTEQWFLRVAPLREKMLEEIRRIRWTPDWAGSSRQRVWTEELRDWTVSRQRYWGTPLPLWLCERCADLRVVASADDLRAGQNWKEGMDLHRPWIDAVTFRCAKCGGTQRRVRDVSDVWFDSAVASWAQLGYPREREAFERWWPADWIVEGPDQTRGWFNSQLTAGAIAFDQSPYESILMHGWMVGPDGRQMHKSLGNYIEPSDVIAKHGVDAFRLYLVRANAPWEDVTFSWEDVKNAGRTLNILFNVYKFAATYMAMDRFDPEATSIDDVVKALAPEDRWILSRAERLKETVSAELDAYELHRAARAIEDFVVEDLSRWYVKLVRDRMWREGEDRAKIATYRVLHEALTTAAKLLAPFCPHIAEEVYQNLDGRLLTVHMSDWPQAREDFLSADLEKAMNTVRDLVDIVAKVRQKENVKLRWPARSVALKAPTEEATAALKSLKHVFLDMANAKELKLLPAEGQLADMALALVPDPQAIGKVYKAWWSKIATMLEMRPAAEVMRELEARGEYRMGIEGQMIKIQPNMVRLEHRVPEGVVRVATPYGELFVDLRVNDEIRAEGMAREVVRRVQQMRKDLDLDVEDYVRTAVRVPESLVPLLEPWREYIQTESRSRTVIIGTGDVDEEYIVEWPNVEGETLVLGVTPLHMRDALAAFTRIPGITQRKAMALFDAGYKSLTSLRPASRDELVKIEGLDQTDMLNIREFLDRGVGPEEATPCSICGAPWRTGESVCWRCGEPLAGTLPCPSCSKPIPKGTYVCPHCGFGGAPARPTGAVPAPAVAPPAALESAEPSIDDILAEASARIEARSPRREPTLEEILAFPEPKADAEEIDDLPELPARRRDEVPMRAEKPGVPTPPPTIPIEAPSATPARLSRPAAEPSAPVVAASVPGQLPRPAIQPATSSTYLVKEGRPEQGYALFLEAMRRGRKGFCVTRVYPAKIREKYGIGANVPILWLSNVGKEDSVRPKDMEKLSLALEQFITRENGIVLIDGIEYLITNNNFLTVLRLVQALRDQVAINGATMVISVNPETLDAHQMNLLEKEVDASVSA